MIQWRTHEGLCDAIASRAPTLSSLKITVLVRRHRYTRKRFIFFLNQTNFYSFRDRKQSAVYLLVKPTATQHLSCWYATDLIFVDFGSSFSREQKRIQAILTLKNCSYDVRNCVPDAPEKWVFRGALAHTST